MATSLTQEGQRLAKKVLFHQSLIAILLSLVYALSYSLHSGLSALLGAIICILPGWVFAFFAFRFAGASQNRQVVRSINQGSKLKFILTILLFVAAYRWPSLQPIPLMVSYIVTMMAQWATMIFISRVNR